MTTNSSDVPETTAWISQAEAARLRGVSRQAIAKLVNQSRLRALTVAGHSLVFRKDVENYQPRGGGRIKRPGGMSTNLEVLKVLLQECSVDERLAIFAQLGEEFKHIS